MRNNKYLFAGIGFILLLFGISIGVFVKNFPGVTYKNEVDLISVLTFLVTLGIGVIFPFLIKKWIDDNKSIKYYLVAEIEELEKIYKKNIPLFKECLDNKEITGNDKDKVNFNLFEADLQLENIQSQFQVSFPNENEIVKSIKEYNEKYYHFLTGGDLMISDFKIDNRFYKEHQTHLSKLVKELKIAIHKTHKL